MMNLGYNIRRLVQLERMAATKEPKLLVTEGAASVTLASLYGGLSSHGSFWRYFFLANRERGPVPVIRAARDIATFGSALL
jgi:hypothetical protein